MIKMWKQENTEKFPYRYFLQTKLYTASTTSKEKHEKLIKHFEFSDAEEFTSNGITKLQMIGFTIIKNK